MKIAHLVFGIVVFGSLGTVYAVHRQRENERFAMRRRILIELAQEKELKQAASRDAMD